MYVNRKALLVFLPLCLLASSTIAFGAITILSNVVTVNINYLLTLSVPSLSGSTVTMKATVTNGILPVQNANIAFFHCDSLGGRYGVNATALNTIVSNQLGEAVLTYVEPTNGVYHYVAIYVAP